MLLAHDLLLLFLDDETGRIVSGVSEPDMGLAGAVLVDLTSRGLVDIAGDNDEVRKGRLVLRPHREPPSDPVLRRGLDVVGQQMGRKPGSALGPLAKGLRDQLADDLVEARILRRSEHKILGLFRTTRLPANNHSHEAALRIELSKVLSGEQQPDERTGPLIALLHATDSVTKVFKVDDKRAVRKRAKQVAEGDWAAAAVRQAVQNIQAAVITTIAATSAAASSGST